MEMIAIADGTRVPAGTTIRVPPNEATRLINLGRAVSPEPAVPPEEPPPVRTTFGAG